MKPHAVADFPSAQAPAETPEVTALVARAQAGDAEAFEDLIRLYERRVIAIGIQMGLSREDAQDACQDAFVKVFRYIARFDSGRSFFKWLYRIAMNTIYDQLKRARQPATISIEEIDAGRLLEIRDAAISMESRLETADLARHLLAGLNALTRQERAVFTLRDMQQVPTPEISQILRISQVTVRRHCMSARRKLRDRFFETRSSDA